MANISTTYQPHGSTTTAEGPDYAYSSPLTPEVQSLIQSLFLARLRAAQRPRPSISAAPAPVSAGPAPATMTSTADTLTPNERIAAMREEAAKAYQYQAMTSPPPMRMVSGAQINPGYMPDVNAMSGIQRSIYLPQQARAYPIQEEPDYAQDDPRNPYSNAARAAAQYY
jgi:hypothetical protein